MRSPYRSACGGRHTSSVPASPAILLLLACGRPEDDAARYVEALDAGAGGLALCAEIRGDALRGDCTAWTARALLAAGDQPAAERACAGLPDGDWRSECYFQLADLRSPQPEEALRLCAQAGGFAAWCRNHVVRRTLEAQVAQTGRGEEAQAEQVARAEAARLLGAPAAEETARRVVSRHIAARGDMPFDREATCGTAPRQTCTAAMEERLLSVAWGDEPDPAVVIARLEPLCRQPLSSAQAEAAGFFGWADSSDMIARRAWAGVCARVHRSAADPQQLLRPAPLP